MKAGILIVYTLYKSPFKKSSPVYLENTLGICLYRKLG